MGERLSLGLPPIGDGLEIRRPTFWLTLCSLMVLVGLVGLGTWQMHRLDWKNALIEERATRMAAPALPLQQIGDDWRDREFRRVTARGRFLHDREMLVVSRTHRGRPGVHVVTPFVTATSDTVLVVRGWVPRDLKDPVTRLGGQITGDVTLRGVIRAGGRPGDWIPDNDPGRDVWHFAEIRAMARRAGLTAVRPFLIEADVTLNPGGYPVGGQTRAALPNNHFQYALTWYGLAVVLAGIYIAFHLKRRD